MRIIKGIIFWIYRIIAGIVTLPFWIFIFGMALTISKKKEYESSSRFYNKLFALGYRACAWFAGARVTVTGKEKLPSPEGEKFLMVGNHTSNLDPFIMGGWLSDYPMAFISKPSVFDVPFAGRYMWRLRYMAIDRSNNRQGIQVIRKAADMISSGGSNVAVYPEGTRNFKKGTLKKFHDGSLKSALWAKCPIVVCVMHNNHDIADNWKFWTTKVTMEIIDVIPYESIKDMKTNEIADIIKDKMQERLDNFGK